MSGDRVADATEAPPRPEGGRRPGPADGFHEAPPIERMRAFLARRLLSPLQGITFGGWCELIGQSRGRIDPAYWPRAALLAMTGALNSAYATIDRAAWGRKVDAVEVAPPVFILGHYRSGTTHLQNLLSIDPRFAFPTVFQAFNPLTFLSSEAMFTPMTKALLVRRRPQDNVAIGVDLPTEDEMALCATTFLSPYLGWALPRREEDYDRYLTFCDAPEAEVARWKAAFLGFLRKLTYAHGPGRPIVLKSPPHTGRVRLLLELFPDARFVLIRREPYTVFRSSRHLYEAVAPYFRLQHPPGHIDRDERILAVYRIMLDAYFDDRALIPPGRLHEVGFEDLERDPLAEVRATYEALDLPPFDVVEPRLRDYLATIADYRKSRHLDLPDPLRLRIADHWRRSFDAWGYPT